MSQDEFIRYWIEEHCPVTAKVLELRQYKCYPMIDQLDGPGPPFDAVAYIAFDDEESCRAGLASDEFRTVAADGPNFQTVEDTYGFVAREYVIVSEYLLRQRIEGQPAGCPSTCANEAVRV